MSTDRRPTILVGVSGSPASEAALRWAENEAEQRHGRLRIVLSWHPELRAFYAGPARSPDGSGGRERARRHLSETIRTVLRPAAQTYTTVEVVEGSAERTLVAESAAADLLVLGSGPGMSIGPVIRACLSLAHCPVVVVNPRMLSTDEPQEVRPRAISGGYPGGHASPTPGGALLAVSDEAYPAYSRWHGPLPCSCSVDQLTDGEPVPHRDYTLDVPEARY